MGLQGAYFIVRSVPSADTALLSHRPAAEADIHPAFLFRCSLIYFIEESQSDESLLLSTPYHVTSMFLDTAEPTVWDQRKFRS
jgi:hypothetical protein